MLFEPYFRFSFCIVFFFPPSIFSASNVSILFSSLSSRNFILLGDAYLRNGFIGLTRELGVPSSGAGAVVFNSPICFFERASNSAASFSSRFTFTITNLSPNTIGDGLSFFISAENQSLGRPGGYLGLTNSSKNKFIAVEFDTHLDSVFGDPNDNHVGFNMNSARSLRTADPQGVDLKSGKAITAWIDYKNELANLDLFLSYSSANAKPSRPILSVGIDLSSNLKDMRYAGFSASLEGSTELHTVMNWSFHTYWFSTLHRDDHPSGSRSSPVLSTRKHHRSNLFSGIGIAFFIITIFSFGYISVKKHKKRGSKAGDIVPGPREFTYKQLKQGTRGFHPNRVLGNGAFGTVYKAHFSSSSSSDSVAAVKRSKHSHEGRAEFLAELSAIASLRHRNLVPLRGWCVERGELMLVYEFMPNGSLDKHLHETARGCCSLRWSQRLNIAIGLASVLTYLHQECERRVIHRDIKSSNVMLDGSFGARLGDFGLARIVDHGKSPVSTLTAGTIGYLAPEYLQCGKATERTDVYGYGVVVLELACGRRAIEGTVNLVDWVWRLYSEGRLVDASDGNVRGGFVEEEMSRLLLVGLSCANPDWRQRPSMRKVLQILNGESADLPLVPTVKPSLSFSSINVRPLVSDSEESKSIDSLP